MLWLGKEFLEYALLCRCTLQLWLCNKLQDRTFTNSCFDVTCFGLHRDCYSTLSRVTFHLTSKQDFSYSIGESSYSYSPIVTVTILKKSARIDIDVVIHLTCGGSLLQQFHRPRGLLGVHGEVLLQRRQLRHGAHPLPRGALLSDRNWALAQKVSAGNLQPPGRHKLANSEGCPFE